MELCCAFVFGLMLIEVVGVIVCVFVCFGCVCLVGFVVLGLFCCFKLWVGLFG